MDRLVTLLVIVCVIYFIEDSFGVALLMMLGIAWSVSLCIPILFKNKIEAFVTFSKQSVEKGETIIGKLTLKNKLPLPTPWIDMSCIEQSQLHMNNPRIMRIMIGPRECREIDFSYTALTRGVTSVGIEQIVFKNPFGFRSVNSSQSYKRLQQLITVMPEIYSISPSHPLIIGSMQPNEEECTQQEVTMNGISSNEIGFECRAYEAGDGLNRIHWKQSAKYGAFMVRKNVYASKGKQVIVLDPIPAIQYKTKEKEYRESSVLEGFLSMGNALYQSGVETELCFWLGNEWTRYPLENIESITKLQLQMASYPFVEGSTELTERLRHVIHDGQQSINKIRIVLFSAAPEEEIEQAVDFYSERNIHLIPVCHNELRERGHAL